MDRGCPFATDSHYAAFMVEKLPVVKRSSARFLTGSCQLDGGGDPDAGWSESAAGS